MVCSSMPQDVLTTIKYCNLTVRYQPHAIDSGWLGVRSAAYRPEPPGIDAAAVIDFYCCYADLLGAANE